MKFGMICSTFHRNPSGWFSCYSRVSWLSVFRLVLFVLVSIESKNILVISAGAFLPPLNKARGFPCKCDCKDSFPSSPSSRLQQAPIPSQRPDYCEGTYEKNMFGKATILMSSATSSSSGSIAASVGKEEIEEGSSDGAQYRRRGWHDQQYHSRDSVPKISSLQSKSSFSNDRTHELDRRYRHGKNDTIPSFPSSTAQPRSKEKQRPKHSAEKKKQSRGQSWQAGYYTSLKTQGLLQRAAAGSVGSGSYWKSASTSPRFIAATASLQRSINVLQTLLLTPPSRCNAANLVYALTMTAKLSHRKTDVDDKFDCNNSEMVTTFRSLFLDTVEVLRERVSLENKKKGGLTARQLCNVAWALAKHVDKDPSLLKLSRTNSNIDEDKALHKVDTVLNRSSHSDPISDDMIVELAVDEIAVALTKKLQSNSTLVKNGELCMAAWAYGILRERSRPPGWKTRPRLGHVILPKRQDPKSDTAFTEKQTDGESFFRFVRSKEWNFKTENRPTPTRTSNLGQFGKFSSIVEDEDDNEDDKNYVNDDEEKYGISLEEMHSTIVPVPTTTNNLFDEIALALSQPAPSVEIPAGHGSPRYEKNGAGLTQQYTWRIDTCQWSELANVAWAFATHGWACSPSAELLLMRIANETARRLQQEQRQRQGRHFRNSGFTNKLETISTASSRDIAQLIWSLGILQSDNFRLADSLLLLVDTLRKSLQQTRSASLSSFQSTTTFFAEWSCPDLVQVALSLAHARLDEGDILRSLYEEALQRLPKSFSYLSSGLTAEIGRKSDRKSFHFWEMTILLWAQARLHLTGEQGTVFEEFSERAVATIHGAVSNKLDGTAQTMKSVGIGSQEKANLVWSLVILEQYNSTESIDLLSQIFAEVVSECEEHGFIQLEHAHQLWQALFILDSESPMAVEHVPRWFHEYLQSKWRCEKARPKLSSARHKALSQALSQMGVAHQNEHEEDIDVAIVLEPNALWTHQAASTNGDGDKVAGEESMIKVAVEFDGPNHFTRQTKPGERGKFSNELSPPPPPRSLGHSILKYRLLKKQGWKVIRIPYYEFDKIPFWASMERQRYLQRLLKTHSTLKFSDVDVSEYKPPVLYRKSRFD